MAVVKNRYEWVFSLQFALLDLASLIVCGSFAAYLRYQDLLDGHFTALNGFLVALICWIGLLIIGGYEAKRDMATLRYASEHALAMGMVLLFAFVATYSIATFNNSVKPGRSVLFVALTLFAILSLFFRYRHSHKMREKASQSPVYVIGSREFGSRVRAICQRMEYQYPLRFMELAEAKAVLSGMNENGGKSPALQAVQAEDVKRCEAVIVDLPGSGLDSAWKDLLLQLNLHTVSVYPVQTFIETYFHKIDLEHVTIIDVLDGTFKPDHHTPYGNVKTLLDVTFGTFLLVLFLPLMLVLALLIKLQDGGPVFFTQTRVGRFEQPFLLFKFRTMNICHEDDNNPYTSKDDRRVTPIGRLLRLMRLDELPQLWNVIKGEMSIIGPRAEWEKLVERYKKEIPFYRLRYMVKPGITGWAQVNYGYGAGADDSMEKLQYDLYYIKHYSPGMDASIVLKTLYIMLSASGR